jgi:hypothetical protein
MNDHIPDGSKMDTPETDELINANLDKLGLMRLAMFCQRLERGRNQAIKERDKARECLREAICYRDSTMSGYDLEEWREAAGLTNSANNKNAPIINWEDK